MEENLKNFLKSQGFFVKEQIGYGLTSNVYHCPHDKGI